MAQTFNLVPDRSSGDVFTEAMWDDHIRTNINNLVTPAACRLSATTVISSAAAGTVVPTWTTEEYDTDGMVAAGGTAITIQTPGVYFFNVAFDPATTATGTHVLFLSFNNYALRLGSAGTGNGLSIIYNVGSADSVALAVAFLSGGGTITTGGLRTFSATMLGRTVAPT